MKMIERMRNALQGGRSSENGSPEASSEDSDQVPIRGYDRMDAKEIGDRLSDLSQVELEAVEAYERSHKDRPKVLDKLRFMRSDEPLPGYDEMSPEQITEALADADAETVKAVRDYERKFGRRSEVMEEAARVLPGAQASPEEAQLREDRATRVREGIAGRKKTADGLADRE